MDIKKSPNCWYRKITKKSASKKLRFIIKKAYVFTFQIQEATENAKTCTDSQKNMSLPLTGISQEYYKRQLWIHNFCIHGTVQNQATMFAYAENYAGKGANEVLSCLDFYIRCLPSEISKLYIFADNCFFKIETGISLRICMQLRTAGWMKSTSFIHFQA